MRDDFAVFILSHGRPDKQHTLKSLKAGNYTGKWFIILDNEDPTINDYIKKYGKDKIYVFDKRKIEKTFDTADNFDNRKTIVFARNYSFELAKKLGLRYFLQLDDDYTGFLYRVPNNGKLIGIVVRQLDRLFEGMIHLLDTTGALTVAFAQGGDFIGGAQNDFLHRGFKRKAMNTFFCDVKKEFKFLGRINEDVNTYTTLGSRGHLIFSIAWATINQVQTQKNKGGMTETYLDNGTYVKSFYTVMFMPSCVKIASMGFKHRRVHHKIQWNNCVPKILDEHYRKQKSRRTFSNDKRR